MKILGNSKKILLRNGLTDSENDSIDLYTFDVKFCSAPIVAAYRSERVSGNERNLSCLSKKTRS